MQEMLAVPRVCVCVCVCVCVSLTCENSNACSLYGLLSISSRVPTSGGSTSSGTDALSRLNLHTHTHTHTHTGESLVCMLCKAN